MSKTFGIAGTSRVGTAFARRLIDTGCSVQVWNRTPGNAISAVDADAEFIECPVGGTAGPALTGQLLGMAGGTKSSFDRAKPTLDQLCRCVEH